NLQPATTPFQKQPSQIAIHCVPVQLRCRGTITFSIANAIIGGAQIGSSKPAACIRSPLYFRSFTSRLPEGQKPEARLDEDCTQSGQRVDKDWTMTGQRLDDDWTKTGR